MTSHSRVIWNGAISFGLVNIPVALHTATGDAGLDFEWLDKRTLDPVGYRRINKKTGQEIDNADIVKGIAYGEGRYVVLSEDEIRRNLTKSTQTIEIESFVTTAEIPPAYFERPYYLAPISKGDKAYALLRETLAKTQRVGLARVVIQTKQHLAALAASGPALVLLLLRWASQIRPWDELNLPPQGAAGLTERELAMAEQLVEAMAAPWEPERFQDSFTAKVMALVEEKAGQIAAPVRQEAAPAGEAAAGVIDFTELLRRSLNRPKAGQSGKPPSEEGRTVRRTGAEGGRRHGP
ncbi:MAG: Ku protein [Negativicutes bacterium]|nr:Ku protein [Negativicutes bacterium]